MARVPSNRNGQPEKWRSGRQETIIMGGVPVPAGKHSLPDPLAQFNRLTGVEYWDEVARKPELVRRLKGSGFTGLFSQEVCLPHGVAESFEDFETGLRAAGFIGVDEVLCQSFERPAKFRVKKVRVAVDAHNNPSGKAAAPSGPVPSLTEVPKRLRNRRGSQSRALERKRPLTGEEVAPLPLFSSGGCEVPIKLRRRREDLI